MEKAGSNPGFLSVLVWKRVCRALGWIGLWGGVGGSVCTIGLEIPTMEARLGAEDWEGEGAIWTLLEIGVCGVFSFPC